jgi:hypothetical protein
MIWKLTHEIHNSARKLPWSTLWLILSEALTLYKMTLFNREEAMKIIEEEEALHEARRIYRIKMRNKESSKDPENETFQFHKNMPSEISEMIEKLKTTNPKLYQEALQIKDVKGAFAFMREYKGL